MYLFLVFKNILCHHKIETFTSKKFIMVCCLYLSMLCCVVNLNSSREALLIIDFSPLSFRLIVIGQEYPRLS